ncbi:MAG: hypothetical protein ACOZAL_03760 [Patescibacteria group bacterium]
MKKIFFITFIVAIAVIGYVNFAKACLPPPCEDCPPCEYCPPLECPPPPECWKNSDCDDGLICNGQETCKWGQCVSGTSIDCSANNISAIETCTNSPDDNPLTWDFRTAFISQCQEPSGTCSTGISDISHTCNKTQCGGCETDADCDDQNQNTSDTCNLTTCQCEYSEIPPQPYCGDGTCQGEETCSNCSQDCGICPVGGNGGGGGGGSGGTIVSPPTTYPPPPPSPPSPPPPPTPEEGEVAGETAIKEGEGEVLGEAVTRLPTTGGNPFLIMIIALTVAFAALLGIIILVYSIKNEKSSKKNYNNRTDNNFYYCYNSCHLSLLAFYKLLSFSEIRRIQQCWSNVYCQGRRGNRLVISGQSFNYSKDRR